MNLDPQWLKCSILYFFLKNCFLFGGAGIKPGASCMLAKVSTTELHPHPKIVFFYLWVTSYHPRESIKLGFLQSSAGCHLQVPSCRQAIVLASVLPGRTHWTRYYPRFFVSRKSQDNLTYNTHSGYTWGKVKEGLKHHFYSYVFT